MAMSGANRHANVVPCALVNAADADSCCCGTDDDFCAH